MSRILSGGGLILESGVADPTDGPTTQDTTLQMAWPDVPTGYQMRGINWDYENNCWLRLLTKINFTAGTSIVQSIDPADGSLISDLTLDNVGPLSEHDHNSVCKVGTVLAICSFDKNANGGAGSWQPVKFSSIDGTYISDGTSQEVTSKGRAAVGRWQGTGFCWAYEVPNDEYLRVRDYANNTLTDAYDVDWAGKSSSIMFLEYDDPGLNDVLTVVEGSRVRQRVYAASGAWPVYTGTDAMDNLWLGGGVEAGGAARSSESSWKWNAIFAGGQFHSFSDYAAPSGEEIYVAYADTDGAASHTKASPIVEHVLGKGRFLLVSLPVAQDEVLDADVFAAKEPSLPALAVLDLVTAGVWTSTRSVVVDPADIETGGAAPHTTNTWAASTPAFLENRGQDWGLFGDGSAFFDNVDLPNVTTLPSLTTVGALADVPTLKGMYDTGWQDVTYASGYTNTNGQLAYRVYGKQVFIKGSATKASGDFNDTAATVATLPATDVNGNPLRPPTSTHRYANYGAIRRYMAVNINTSGAIQVSVADAPDDPNHTGDYELWPSSWSGLNTSYLLD